MDLPSSLETRLGRLAPDQRAAATADPGPLLCVAPAGSGKTTTLVARIAWLIATGADPGQITALTFNRRAAVELSERLEAALDWLPGPPPNGPEDGPARAPPNTRKPRADQRVRVRTFHALGLEILRSMPGRPRALMDRTAVLRRVLPDASRARIAALDTAISRLKLDLDVAAVEVAADPDAGPMARAYVAYEAVLAEAGGMDFDDLVRIALHALEADPGLLELWRRRCTHLLVDETQDVDRSQLRLALLLAAPANRIFLVGDDDQSIYGWRLADVRRVLGLAAELPGLRRVDLVVNYRCPAPVLARAVRLVEHNQERFAKVIRPGPAAAGQLILAPEPGEDEIRVQRLFGHWRHRSGTQAILARTNRELLPAAAVALAEDRPFQAPGLCLLVEDDRLPDLLEAVRTQTDPGAPPLVRLGWLRDHAEEVDRKPEPESAADGPNPGTTGPGSEAAEAADDGDDAPRPSDPAAADDGDGSPPLGDLAAALLGWVVRYPDLDAFETAIRTARTRLTELRQPDAPLTLATAHATKGLEFDHVAVLGMDDGRFPSARALADADDPLRALEEERRLAYVAWTRARSSLTLVYDSAAPSRFLLEAFDPAELGLESVHP